MGEMRPALPHERARLMAGIAEIFGPSPEPFESFPGFRIIESNAIPPGTLVIVEQTTTVEPAESEWPYHAVTVTKTIEAKGVITGIDVTPEGE